MVEVLPSWTLVRIRRGQAVVVAIVDELDLEAGIGEERIGEDGVGGAGVDLHAVVAVVRDGVAFDQVAGGSRALRDVDSVAQGIRRSGSRRPRLFR